MKPDRDDREYRVVTLANRMRCVLVHEPNARVKSSAAVAVAVGSQADPDARPGLAHLTEHVLFLGSASYPLGDYSRYVSQHGGYVNAWTSGEHTVYHLAVDSSALDGAVARLGEFFTAPLLAEEAVEKEVTAVDDEFKSYGAVDGRRVYEVAKRTSDARHPHSRFSVGSRASLVPGAADGAAAALRVAVKAFLAEHYFGGRMSLVRAALSWCGVWVLTLICLYAWQPYVCLSLTFMCLSLLSPLSSSHSLFAILLFYPLYLSLCLTHTHTLTHTRHGPSPCSPPSSFRHL